MPQTTSTPSHDLGHPAVGAALSTAAALLGMEVVFIGGLTEDTFTFEQVRGELAGITAGQMLPRTDSFCHRLLSGAPNATADAAHDPAYADTPARVQYGITSYVGVPVADRTGRIVATLCGIDTAAVEVDENAIEVLRRLADVIGAHLGALADEQVMIRRTPNGWQVAGDETESLTSAMILADLLAAELEPGPRPPRPDCGDDELSQLRLSVRQLEHALAARVVVEQAIGVLAERQHIPPRTAFERLRKSARSRGRRVHDLAREVVASVNDRSVPLPPDLTPRR